ncbi:MAG: hypothetical protein L6Q54_11335 [Leptospiraceae bacterium]|nr:hypothetical protein [Leptospiraceae bacterium]MCK6381820.1 hypothetical protein [Leptospiraceae bacterium]NUM40960.1 hypothetical protein [Leptospiraceae bacterium]
MAEENQEKKKNKKISKMSIQEIDSALKKSTETMVGEKSKYVQHLVQRKAELSKK